MNQFCRRLALLPICVAFVASSIAGGAVIENAPTIQDVNNAMQAEDYTHVEKLCREIVDEDSTNAQAWFLLGYSLHAQGELDQAIFAHLTATTFPSTAPLSFYNLGCAHALKGNTDQAFKALHKAAELGITNPQQYKGDSDLKSLHDDPRWGKLLRSMQPGLVAQSKPKKAPKADAGSSASAMHFWVGEWDVYSAKNGTLVGSNTLAYRVNNHVIHEMWESLGDGSSGESWNYFDPGSGAWKQTWLGSGGDLTEFTADLESDADGIMFVGRSHQPGASEPALHRMHVRGIRDGLVRQTGSNSKDDGATWTISYDLIYVPKGEKFELEDLSI
jgi:hypothetical protein